MEENIAIKALGALAQETRLRIIRYLVAKGNTGASAGEIADTIGGASSRMSFHLSNLENAGLVTSKRQSRFIIYTASFENLGGLMSFLLSDCCNDEPSIRNCCEPKKCC